MIEKPLSEAEKKRNHIILKLGENILTSTNELAKNNITIIGDYYYQIIKTKLPIGLIDFPKLPDGGLNKNHDKQMENPDDDLSEDENNGENDNDNKRKKNVKSTKSTKTIKATKTNKSTKPKEKEKVINSTLKAKLSNIMDSLNKKLDILIKLLQDKPETKIYLDLMNNLNYMEFRILILMKIIQYYTKLKKAEINEVEELVLGSKKILKLLKDIKENKNNEYNNYFKKICNFDDYDISLSDEMIWDLEMTIDNLSSKYGIKLFNVANSRPKLIFDTKYDETIPNMKLKFFTVWNFFKLNLIINEIKIL
jgi:predicted O-linked N-acetylglucosamine transferase (SPINDLY family)